MERVSLKGIMVHNIHSREAKKKGDYKKIKVWLKRWIGMIDEKSESQ